jgi:hypothetical protein
MCGYAMYEMMSFPNDCNTLGLFSNPLKMLLTA